LIDETTISQAEHTGLLFRAAADTVFVGSPTVGADGDITYIALPGGMMSSFTGEAVALPDGTQLQRKGLQPDIAVAPTLAGIRAGKDEVLDAALAAALHDTGG
jgi:C-terminal processing protease CtpA/Prc